MPPLESSWKTPRRRAPGDEGTVAGNAAQVRPELWIVAAAVVRSGLSGICQLAWKQLPPPDVRGQGAWSCSRLARRHPKSCSLEAPLDNPSADNPVSSVLRNFHSIFWKSCRGGGKQMRMTPEGSLIVVIEPLAKEICDRLMPTRQTGRARPPNNSLWSQVLDVFGRPFSARREVGHLDEQHVAEVMVFVRPTSTRSAGSASRGSPRPTHGRRGSCRSPAAASSSFTSPTRDRGCRAC